jgi:hypothetical protein
MYQGEGQHMDVVGNKKKGHLPKSLSALRKGSVGPTMSDLQVMLENERKQHEQQYVYQKGHNDGSAPLGRGSL